MAILGVYDGHNACAAVMSEATGEVVAAVEEERFSRIKNHDGRDPSQGGPVQSIRYCLSRIDEPVNHIALALAEPRELARQSVNAYMLSVSQGATSRLNCRDIRGKGVDYFDLLAYPHSSQHERVERILDCISMSGVSTHDARLHHVPHHIAHTAGAFFHAPVEEALIVTLDGKGDGLCGMVSRGSGTSLKELGAIDYRHSIAHLYAAFTVSCGFRAIRDEGKLTALAAHGQVSAPLLAGLQELFTFDGGTASICGHLNDGLPLGPYPHTLFGLQVERIRNLLIGVEPEDAAATVQLFTEDLVLEFVEHHLRDSGVENLAVAGGLFANVSLNRRLADSPLVSGLYVHPAMSDSGLAVGAVSRVYALLSGERPKPLRDAFLGPSYPDNEAVGEFRRAGFSVLDVEDAEAYLAQSLAHGEVVARFFGGSEYGPRSLGNRSILAPCIDPELPDLLNSRLSRTQIMPFAPMTLEDEAGDMYRGLSDVAWSARFMTVAVSCRERMKLDCPAAVHLDGTARPQLVGREDGRLRSLLERYRAATGISSIINTSLNIHNEPTVLSPSDAVKSIAAARIRATQVGEKICILDGA